MSWIKRLEKVLANEVAEKLAAGAEAHQADETAQQKRQRLQYAEASGAAELLVSHLAGDGAHMLDVQIDGHAGTEAGPGDSITVSVRLVED
jgi:hypothetical protein